MIKTSTKMDELNENNKTENSAAIMKSFKKHAADKLPTATAPPPTPPAATAEQHPQSPHIIRNNNNVNGKYPSTSADGGCSDNTGIIDCNKLECRSSVVAPVTVSIAATENGVLKRDKSELTDETSIDIARILNDTPSDGAAAVPPSVASMMSSAVAINVAAASPTTIYECAAINIPPMTSSSSSTRNSPPTDRNSSESTSTDNLSFGSEADLVNDIVLLPQNFISEDEVSVNSDDCVYAYRGGDVDAADAIMVGGLARGHDESQDDEPDYIEMDFDPDPPSEAAAINGEPCENGGSKSIVAVNDEDADIKIPRLIDKIGEVVELNSMRCRDMHDVPLPSMAKNQRFDAGDDRLKGAATMDEFAAAAAELNGCLSGSTSRLRAADELPAAQMQPSLTKYTGTKPKIRSVRRQSADRLHGGGGGGGDAVVPPSSLFCGANDAYRVPVTNADDSNCERCRQQDSKYCDEKMYSVVGTPCKKCKFNQQTLTGGNNSSGLAAEALRDGGASLYEQSTVDQRRHYYDAQPTCSSSLSYVTVDAWNQTGYRHLSNVAARQRCESPSVTADDWPSAPCLVPAIARSATPFDEYPAPEDRANKKTVTSVLETNGCTEAAILEKLVSREQTHV